MNSISLPLGYSKVTAYTNGRKLVILEQPGFELRSDDESHNCDFMGCRLDHVVARYERVESAEADAK